MSFPVTNTSGFWLSESTRKWSVHGCEELYLLCDKVQKVRGLGQ